MMENFMERQDEKKIKEHKKKKRDERRITR